MTKQPPSAENQMTGKQHHDEPRGRPVDASSYTEEHTSEDRQVHDAPHKALYQQRSRANFSVHRSRIAVNEERESARCTTLSPMAMGSRIPRPEIRSWPPHWEHTMIKVGLLVRLEAKPGKKRIWRSCWQVLQ
jgi:hypothetical protein